MDVLKQETAHNQVCVPSAGIRLFVWSITGDSRVSTSVLNAAGWLPYLVLELLHHLLPSAVNVVWCIKNGEALTDMNVEGMLSSQID